MDCSRRPRLDSIQTLLKPAPAPQAHGGLSAGAMRRVREYMEAHLGESIDLRGDTNGLLKLSR
jgi:hypothetical protein